jgi:hypothetical protein
VVVSREGKMGEKRYFVRYSVGKYDDEENEEFVDLAQVEELLSRHAANPEFFYDVVYGERIEFEPVEVIKAYRVKRS